MECIANLVNRKGFDVKEYGEERKKNVISAIKSLEMEGFVFTEEEKNIFRQIATGTLTTEQARAIFLKIRNT